MKESRLIAMERKVEALGMALQRLVQEIEFLKDLSVGNMQLMKKFEGYEQAVEALKEEVNAERSADTVGDNGAHEVREVSPEQGEA